MNWEIVLSTEGACLVNGSTPGLAVTAPPVPAGDDRVECHKSQPALLKHKDPYLSLVPSASSAVPGTEQRVGEDVSGGREALRPQPRVLSLATAPGFVLFRGHHGHHIVLWLLQMRKLERGWGPACRAQSPRSPGCPPLCSLPLLLPGVTTVSHATGPPSPLLT